MGMPARLPAPLSAPTLVTARLVLRQCQPADLAPFAELGRDRRVMEHFPALLSRDESDRLAAASAAELAELGWGRWALEVAAGPDAGRFAGFAGLSVPGWEPPFGPCVEVAWRLARWAWGRGYATEAAQAAIEAGFADGIPEIVAFTAVTNARSRRVMERLGMERDPARDFDHPLLPEGHALRRHVLYRAEPGGGARGAGG